MSETRPASLIGPVWPKPGRSDDERRRDRSRPGEQRVRSRDERTLVMAFPSVGIAFADSCAQPPRNA